MRTADAIWLLTLATVIAEPAMPTICSSRLMASRGVLACTVVGHFQATGVRPRFLADLAAQGIKIPGSHFDPAQPL